MILTITLNPSIDRDYHIENFEKGKVLRANDVKCTPGGKGLNVARVARVFTDSVMATGYLGGNSGNYIKERLDDLNIRHKFLSINGETRSCLAIHSDDGSETEILEKGPYISREEHLEFIKLYRNLIEDKEVICASGSLPQGLSIETYKELILIAKKQNKKFILDTSGDALKLGIEASPYLVKPNKDELEKLVGYAINSEKDVIKGAQCLLNNNIEIVVISLGEEGAMIFNKDYVYKVNVPTIEVVNSVGSGDSMIAGFAISLIENYDFELMIKFASACGAANAMEEETGKVNIDNVKDIINKINIVKKKI